MYTFQSSAMDIVLKIVILSQASLAVKVVTDLNCDTSNPLVQSDVTCVCKISSGTEIDWDLDGTFHSNCVLSSICLPQYSGFSYKINSTESVYQITMHSYNYSDCTKVTCKVPSDSSDKLSVVPSAIMFDPVFPTLMTEPEMDRSNGNITITTGCISDFPGVDYNWFIIVNGSEEEYFPDNENIIEMSDTSACLSCNTDINGKRTIGFRHTEASGDETKIVYFKVVLHHASTDLNLSLTTSNVYTVKGNLDIIDDDNYSGSIIGLIIAMILLNRVMAKQILLIWWTVDTVKHGHKCRASVFLSFIPGIGIPFLLYKLCPKKDFCQRSFTQVIISTALTLIFGLGGVPMSGILWLRKADRKLSWFLIMMNIMLSSTCVSTELIILICSQDITDELLPMIILLYLALFFVMLSGFKTLLIFRMRIGDSPRKFQSGKPDPPTGLSVPKNDITETSMKLLWKPGFHGVVEQTFQVYLNNKDKKIVRQSDTDGNDCSYKFENLKPETYYDINVKAVNYKGASETKHLRARTLGKPDPPTGLLVANNGITETSIEVLWKPGFDGGFEQTFQVYLDDKEVQLVRQSDTDGNICSYKFENLKPDTLYDIYVKAENIKGEAAKKTHHVHAKTLTQNF